MPILTSKKLQTTCKRCGQPVRWWQPNELSNKLCQVCQLTAKREAKKRKKLASGWVSHVEKRRLADIAITGGSCNPDDLTLSNAFLVTKMNHINIQKRSLSLIYDEFNSIMEDLALPIGWRLNPPKLLKPINPTEKRGYGIREKQDKQKPVKPPKKVRKHELQQVPEQKLQQF